MSNEEITKDIIQKFIFGNVSFKYFAENIVEEIVRTLVGSSALVIAVPITTYLAVIFFSKFGINEKDTSYTPHHH